ncbi:MAG: purine nucleosidase [Lysobacterales bacterium]|jgi:purine nucleosidase
MVTLNWSHSVIDMTNPLPIIIDCDPGQDDAVMLLLAMASPELRILGVTTVAGNVPLPLTERNARIMCDLAGRKDMPVFAGCSQPLHRELVTAEHVHGRTGIDGVEIFEPGTPLQKIHAVDFIINTLKSAEPDSITIVPIGPLSNIGMAIERAPEILPKIHQIVLMGGAMREGGNISASAEFNIYVDPEAAEIVMKCGRPIVVVPLDATHQVLVSKERVERLKTLNSAVAKAIVGMLDFFNRYDTEKYGFEGAPLHDPCTIAWLLQPDLFKGKLCNIEVETQSELTRGHTAVDFWQVTGREPNALFLYEADAKGFFDLLYQRLSHYEN